MSDQPYLLYVQMGDGDPIPAPELTEIINQLIFYAKPTDFLHYAAKLGCAMSEIRKEAEQEVV